MSRRIQAREGEVNVVLPDGWALDGGDVVVVSDDTWNQIAGSVPLLRRVNDLGFTSEVADPVPTWRDIQRSVSFSSAGLDAEINALSSELGAHEADTTNVHGIADTALLETKSGAQAKADTGRDQAKAYTDVHAVDTTNVHGIADTSLLATKDYVDAHEVPQYRGTFNFAVSTSTWYVAHNQNTFALHVEAFTNDDQPIRGHITYPDANHVQVDFYFPVSGYLRLWD